MFDVGFSTRNRLNQSSVQIGAFEIPISRNLYGCYRRQKNTFWQKILVNPFGRNQFANSLHSCDRTIFTKYHQFSEKFMYMKRAPTKNSMEENHTTIMNIERSKLQDACKTIVFLPDQAYFQLKWKVNHLNHSRIDIKRSESHMPKHLFATTMLRRDICERYERF